MTVTGVTSLSSDVFYNICNSLNAKELDILKRVCQSWKTLLESYSGLEAAHLKLIKDIQLYPKLSVAIQKEGELPICKLNGLEKSDYSFRLGEIKLDPTRPLPSVVFKNIDRQICHQLESKAANPAIILAGSWNGFNFFIYEKNRDNTSSRQPHKLYLIKQDNSQNVHKLDLMDDQQRPIDPQDYICQGFQIGPSRIVTIHVQHTRIWELSIPLKITFIAEVWGGIDHNFRFRTKIGNYLIYYKTIFNLLDFTTKTDNGISGRIFADDSSFCVIDNSKLFFCEIDSEGVWKTKWDYDVEHLTMVRMNEKWICLSESDRTIQSFYIFNKKGEIINQMSSDDSTIPEVFKVFFNEGRVFHVSGDFLVLTDAQYNIYIWSILLQRCIHKLDLPLLLIANLNSPAIKILDLKLIGTKLVALLSDTALKTFKIIELDPSKPMRGPNLYNALQSTQGLIKQLKGDT